MTNENLDISSISQNNSGYPDYLDFNSLRTAAINFLGPITASYWTDYNVHDPGVTTLEVLMYALLDLGYRANMPIANLLATPPGGTSTDTNFFTPAQILGSNPTSVTDYRKLFMDIGQVRNAWMVPVAAAAQPPPVVPLNGLYKIYLELEMDLPDFATTKEWEEYQKTVRREVKHRWNAHRNLCEDLDEADIHILKKKYIGISADLEIVPGVSIPAVYQAMVGALYPFFSPVPSFYTLPQLQAMGISMDAIFSGRPYTGLPSHGFILDTDLPDFSSGTPVNVSAVYQQILSVSGIATVRKLKLLDLDGTGSALNQWEFPVPDGWIPEFSIAGSSFRWFQNGQPLSVDLGAYTSSLALNAAHSGKVLYPPGAPDLDAAIPNGTYQAGLGDYYSIQNDFPQVYGIGAGGVPSTATDLRKSQAFQFKAYLLFFDQLLADYLAQLSSLRAIFSMSPPANPGDANTYFAGSLSTVPGLDDLLSFPPAAGDGDDGDAAPVPGNTLAFPVAPETWQSLIKAGKVSSAQLSALAPCSFTSANQRDVAVAELTLVLSNQPPAVQYLQTSDGLWVYYLAGIWNSFVLLSQNNFPTQVAAAGEAASVAFIGATQANYNLISLAGEGSYSFTLQQTTAAYYNYLQTILEDPQEYTQRRTAFLEHLMARFAVSFTDYALLSAGFLSQQEIASKQLGLMEGFLAKLPALSGDRGKAFNYSKPGWDTDNISGYEKRIKAFCGIGDESRHYLCNFEVHKYEDRFNVKMALAGEDLFNCPSPLRKKETVPAAQALFKSLGGKRNYRAVWREERDNFCLEVGFYERYVARSVAGYIDEREAMQAADLFCQMWRTNPGEEDSWICKYHYRSELIDYRGLAVRTNVEAFPEEKTAHSAGKKGLKKINDPAVWTFHPGDSPEIGKLTANRDAEKTDQYLDSDGFRVYVQKDVIGKPDRCRFELLDIDNTYQFRSKKDFATEDQARAACYQLLHYLANDQYYHIRKMPYGGPYRVGIRVDGQELAESDMEYAREDLAREMIVTLSRLFQQRLYTLRVVAEPFRWKFNVYLGLPGKGPFVFESLEEYPAKHESHAAAVAFYLAAPHWRLRRHQDDFFLEGAGKDGPSCRLVSGPDRNVEEWDRDLRHLLKAKAEIYQLHAGDEEALAHLSHLDDPSRRGTHVYRLVDKDHPKGFHPLSPDGPIPHDHAKMTLEEAEQEREQLILKGRRGYTYLEICLGGDNVDLRQGSAGQAGKYYFSIRCRNDYFSKIGIPHLDHELVLFESIIGYDSAADAQTAFQQYYLIILKHAGDPANYGEGKFIRLKAQTHKQEEEGESKGWVLVPRETQDIFEYAALDPVSELVKAAHSYPVKLVHDKYEFTLVQGERRDWVSAHDFSTPGETYTAFDFFLLLLNYPGNYYIEYDWTECSYRVGIREVLAESNSTFPDETTAWGPRGVERFICVAQSGGGFHLDMRRDCTYSFFAACPNHHAIHPCSYETAAQRDEALRKLYQAAGRFPEKAWIELFAGENYFEIRNVRGEPVARIPLPEHDDTEHRLNRILDVEDAVWAGKEWGEDEHGPFLRAGAQRFKIRQVWPVHWKEWQKQLLEFAAYFPIVRNTTLRGGITTTEFLLEIKFPGFVDLSGEARSPKDCGCPPLHKGDAPYCFLAWKSDQVFPNATDAWNAYEYLLVVLADRDNYRSVYGHETGNYGIQLHERKDIVARNPQYYAYPAMAIEGLGRARVCINAEGLDLVEHLLLRPGLQAPLAPGPGDQSGCSSLWGTTFNPGADPYSFIVTVVLPAWPARFRTNENRLLLESILQEECPAHVMLRIFWLVPRDMCRFEYSYRGWLNSLMREAKGRESCPAFIPEKFLDFLFTEVHPGLPECTECGDRLTAHPAPPAEEWLRQVNLLYGWNAAGSASFLTNERDRRRLLTARLNRYQEQIEEWRILSRQEELAGKTAAFLKDPDPSMKRFESLLTELIRVGKTAGGSGIHRMSLAGIAISFYLDKIIMDPGDGTKWEHLTAIWQVQVIEIDQPEQFYEEWQAEEMHQLVRDLDTTSIQALIRGEFPAGGERSTRHKSTK